MQVIRKILTRANLVPLTIISVSLLAVLEYRSGCNLIFTYQHDPAEYYVFPRFFLFRSWPLLVPVHALLPLAIFALAVRTPARGFRESLIEPWVAIAGFAFAVLLGFSFWLGWYDATETFVAANLEDHSFPWAGGRRSLLAELSPRHHVSWVSLVLPVVLVAGLVFVATVRSRRTPRRSLRGKRLSRGVLFAVLSVTGFVTAATVNYCTAKEMWYVRSTVAGVPRFPLENTFGWSWWFLFGASFAVFPVVPLALCVRWSPSRLRDPWLLASSVLCACALGLCSLRGGRDYWFASDGDFSVSWFMIVPAMCLALGVMALGAWRRSRVDGSHSLSPNSNGGVDSD